MKYIYRVDRYAMLETIRAEGFKCGSAHRVNTNGMPEETSHAKAMGWPIPTEENMYKPRIYFWREEQFLIMHNTLKPDDRVSLREAKRKFDLRSEKVYAAIRWPLSLMGQTCYPDGFFPDKAAYYAIFPQNEVDDRVIPGSKIEIRRNGKWMKLSTYLTLSKLHWFLPGWR